jgi:hypothetical protein
MTIIELLFFMTNLAFVIAACLFGAHAFGFVGAVSAAIAALACEILFYSALAAIGKMLQRFYPAFPVCRNGKCGTEDYTCLRSEASFAVYVCKCGNTYINVRRRFLELLPNGTERRFMRRTVFGKWMADNGENDSGDLGSFDVGPPNHEERSGDHKNTTE